MPRHTRHFDPDALRRIRRARGMTQQQLADAMGVARHYAVSWERQGRDPATGRPRAVEPEPANLVRLAEILDVAPHELTTVDVEEATLADLRTWAGLTQKELAAQVELAGPTISSIEQGRRRLRPEVAHRIAQVLGTTSERVQAAADRHRR